MELQFGYGGPKYKDEIEFKMNNIIRNHLKKKCFHVSHLYQNLNLFKLNIYKLELFKFLHKLYYCFPILFQNRFKKIVHM